MGLNIYFGGTFDPIHDGHVEIARAAQKICNADIYFIPSADPPHRQKPEASARQRADMVKLVVANEPHFFLDERELYRAMPSYTVDTLNDIRDEVGPRLPIAWLIGADAFAQLPSWHDWRRLFDLCHFIVAERPGYSWQSAHFELDKRLCQSPEALEDSPAGRIFRLKCSPRSEAASAIRDDFHSDRSSLGLNQAVEAYILEHGLYRQAL